MQSYHFSFFLGGGGLNPLNLMPYVRIWVHCVWSTKNRRPHISQNLRPLLIEHVKENARSKEIWLDTFNAVRDHAHALLSLKNDQTIAKVMQLIKGESAHWVNSSGLLSVHFEWQDDYFAVSVSESDIDVVRRYIDNQEAHHRMKGFAEEYEEFIKSIGLKPKDEDDN